MKIALIWAMSENRVIGRNNALPWHLPADMRWFRQNTLGKPIVMGRNTYESFGSKALPQRQNIILSRDPDYRADDAQIATSIEQARQLAGNAEELMIIGGASIYRQTLELAERLYMTVVHTDLVGDTYFPEFDQSRWLIKERHDHDADEKNAIACSFYIMERA